jgi:hypothetical protein
VANQIAYESITVSTAAIGPTAATVTARVRSALFFVASNAVRHRADGTAPSASVGLPIEAGGYIIISGEGSIRNAQFIRRDGSDATLHCVYYDDVLDIREVDPLGTSSKTVAIGSSVALDVTAAAITAVGPAAADAAISGNPLRVGGNANNNVPTGVSDGDIVDMRLSRVGHQYTVVTNESGNRVPAINDLANDAITTGTDSITVRSALHAQAPDGSWDRLKTVGETVTSGLGALMVSPTGHKHLRVTADIQVLAGAGKFHSFTIHEVTGAGTITIYDNTGASGAIIAIINLAVTKVPVTLHYDVICTGGLYFDSDGSVAYEGTVSASI